MQTNYRIEKSNNLRIKIIYWKSQSGNNHKKWRNWLKKSIHKKSWSISILTKWRNHIIKRTFIIIIRTSRRFTKIINKIPRLRNENKTIKWFFKLKNQRNI